MCRVEKDCRSILTPRNAALARSGWLGLLLLLLITLGPFHSAQAGTQLPEDFELIRSSVGVQLYRKEHPNGFPDYVQVIRLDRGAEVHLLHGRVTHHGARSGVYGGLDARFTSRPIFQYWEEIFSLTPRAFCVTNGQFFYMYEYPTRLPFPLKADGKILSGGYAKGEFTGQKLMLEIWHDHADIRPLTKVDFHNSTAPNIVAGLAEDARKSPDKFVGRTFVGVADRNDDGIHETLLIFSTQAARQRDAAKVLRQFGAQKVMMLDGGLSTQLVCQGKPYIQTERAIPQAIAVLDGTKSYLHRLHPQPTPPQAEREMSRAQPFKQENAALGRDFFQPAQPEREPQPAGTPTPTVTPHEGELAGRIYLTDALLIALIVLVISIGIALVVRRLWMPL